MFHQGDLNSGISRAISEGKLVACFVRQDGNEESRVWEEDWFAQRPRMVSQGDLQPAMGDIFATKAVILRIELGSKESDFLNAFCPVTTAPTFLIIHNGQMLEKLEADLGKQEFVERASKALGLDVSIMPRQEFHGRNEAQGTQGAEEIADPADTGRQMQEGYAASGAPLAPLQATTSDIVTPDLAEPTLADAGSSTPEERALSPSAQLQQEDQEANMSSLFPDRAQRMEAEKANREAAEKAARTARQNARRKEAEEAHAAHQDKGKGKSNDSLQKEKARRDWLVQQKQRKDEAKSERERILAQIEADKQERKARTQRTEEAPSEPLPPASDAASKRIMGAGGMCSLSIRLFDGSSIRGRFEPSATLGKTVRGWITETTTKEDKTKAADIPFTFKQILAPLPSRSIEISEENQSLAELGLAPNATIVLIPINGFTEAYSGSNYGSGYTGMAIHTANSIVGTAIGLISSALSYVPGFGRAASTPVETAPVPSDGHENLDSNPSTGSIKVKTLADQRAEALTKQDQQAEFYNGNSSAFEGRKNDDDENGTR